MGIHDDPRRGCRIHAALCGSTVYSGPHAKRCQKLVASHGARPLPSCKSCESCIQYEAWLKEVVETEASKAFQVRRRRGSRFTNKDAVFAIGGIVHKMQSRSSLIVNDLAPSSAMTSQEAFGILAPPISFKSNWGDIVRSSAAKLYFVLTHCRRLWDHRMNEQADGETKWYLSQKEFEKLLISSGVDWMDRSQIFQTYAELDLNKSGFLHVSELCSTFESAEEMCRDILHGLCEISDLRKQLLEISKRPNRSKIACSSLLSMLA